MIHYEVMPERGSWAELAHCMTSSHQSQDPFSMFRALVAAADVCKSCCSQLSLICIRNEINKIIQKTKPFREPCFFPL